MKILSSGQQAEEKVASHFQSNDYKIIGRNWKTKLCEIDIIAQSGQVVFFIEVKYRQNLAQGSGFDYMTEKKLRQLKFSAQMWCSQNDWEGDYRILGVQVSGPDFKIDDPVELT